jgi:hypothetical protein
METTKSNTQRKFKWFWAWQDEKEETWLAEMSRQGWHLLEPGLFGFYVFQAGPPKNYIYRLDFQSDYQLDKGEYLRLFSDAGWQHLGTMGGWQYFRKAVRAGESAEIFTDADSKIAKYRRLIAILLILNPVWAIFLTRLISLSDKQPDVFAFVLTVIFGGFSILYAIAMLALIRRINQLKHL